MAKTITTRLPDDFVKGLKKIAEKEHLDTSAVIRKLLAKAIAEWKKDYAVEQYKRGEFSFEQLANFAGISVWEVPSLLKAKKTHINYDVEELKRELKNIRWREH